MRKETLIKLFKRDLMKLIDELNHYNDASNLWKIDGLVSNSAGNLCLHIIGNLNTYIGANLGDTGYIRKRELEFSLKNVPREELLKQFKDTILIVENTLLKLKIEDLQQEYQNNPFKTDMTTEYFLTHLAMHLAYHLGQINYHRRLLDS